jgi:hypothetical protein
MQSEEDQYRSTTTIDDLPDEVIELIFNKTSFQCALICGLVSKRWLKVSNQNTTFMQKVQLKVQDGEGIAEQTYARTYKLILLERLNPKKTNYEKLLENCEKLCLDYCRFNNMAQLAHLLAGCKNLKSLDLSAPKLAAYGSEGLEEAECFANHSAIDLELTVIDIHQWRVLQLFKIIKLDIGQLQITVVMTEPYSQVADMMDYVHHNHRSVFKVFMWNMFGEKTISPLFFSQIKQLMSLTIRVHSEKVLNRIAKNLTELKNLSVNLDLIDEESNSLNLNNLKALTKLETLDIGVCTKGGGSLSLYVRELQQLKKLQVRHCISGGYGTEMSRSITRLKFPDLTPQHTLNSMETLNLINYLITRNMLQLIFRTMPNLQNLLTRNPNPNSYYVQKRLTRNKNGIHRLKYLKKLNIDYGWIDENFLRNMKLPQLQSFILHSSKPISFSELSNIGLLHMAQQCPKLMEIRAQLNFKPVVVIASRNSSDCAFNNQEDDNVNDDGESSDYSENDVVLLEDNSDADD